MKGKLVKAYIEREGRHNVLKFALKLLGMDTEFREEDHPRDESGRFTSGGGNTGSAKPASETKQKETTTVPEGFVEDPDFDIFSFEEEEETPEEIAARKEKEQKAEREEKERGRYGNNGLREEDYPEDLRLTSEEQKIVADIFREYKDPEFKSSGSADVMFALNGLTTQEHLDAREKKLKEAIQQSTEEINKKKESGYTYKTHNPQSTMTGRQKLAQWWNDVFEHGAPINNWGENGIQYWQRLRAESQRQSKQIDLAKKIVKRNEFAQKQPGYMPWKKNPNRDNPHYRPWLENDSIGKDAEFREEDHPRDENGKFTSGNGNRAPKSSSEIREMVVGQHNWLDNVVTKSDFDFLHEARKKREDLEKQYLEKQKAAEEELVNVDPQLGRLFSGMFEENYSEKGRQLLKEAKELKPQIDEAEMDEKYWQKKLKDKKKANHDKQVASFRPEPLKKATKEDYEGFKLEGDTSGLRDALESGKAQVYEMSPKEYLERCAYEIFDGSTIENTIAGTEADNVNKYADLMASGEKFAVPYLDYDTQNQEGRHRALAAMINGIKTIPVAIIGKPPKRGANDAEFREEDHPREEDGKFAPKGGGSSSSGSGNKHSEAVIKAASEARNYADFWYNLPEDEQRKYKTSEEIKKAYEEAKAVAPEAPEWKPTVGTKADMPKSVKLPEKLPEIKIVNNPNDTATAHAGKPGEIEINLANFDPENIDSIIAHEAAHQMSNSDPELQAAIMQNFGDVLGRYNQKKQHFDGIYGEYNPEEAFATGFSNYLNHPEHMKEHYPDAYEYFDDLAKNQPETVDFLRNTIQKAKNAVSGNEKPERSDSKYYKDLEKRRNIALSWKPDRQAEYLFRQGFLTEEDAIEAMENGTVSDRMQDYFAVMEYNGDPTPTKPVREAPDMYTEVKNGKGGGDWVQARKDYIKEWTGQSDEEVEETYDQLHTWFSNQWGRANTETIDRYIDQDGACGREIYRGMHFTEDEYAEFMKNVAPGAKIGMNGRNSSWTTNREDAWNFCRNGDRQVIITCKKNKTSAPVEHLSDKGESEVLAHSCAQWTVIGIQEGSNRTEITVYEAEERMSPEERDRRKAQNDAEPEESREVSLEERMNGQNRFITVTPPSADLFKRKAKDGGPGSGNWGHNGRPGKVGGSQKESGGSALRTGSKESGYSSFAKHEAFKGIVSHARASENYRDFIRGMSNEQKDALRDQRIACGTSENMQKYAERIYRMLRSRNAAPETRQKSVIVEGKDMTQEFDWDGKPYTDKKFGQVIDTEIEAVIDAQGFNGVPKIVSQAELNKIVKENPQIPLLYRSYAASSPEELKSYNDMLEKGEWYVDCGAGGAQYGQGMYCAGVYQQEPLYKWNDPGYHPDDYSVFVDKKNNGYKTISVDAEDSGDLIVGKTYIAVDRDDKNHLIKMDEDSYLWTDAETGALVDESFVDDLCKVGEVYACEPIDMGIYADAFEKERKVGIERAKDEMRHYRNLNLTKIAENTKPIIPDGMKAAIPVGGGDYYYYDPQYSKAFSEGPPIVARNLVCVTTPGNEEDKTIWRVSEDGKGLISLDETIKLDFDQLEPYQEWSYVLGRCEYEKVNPVATTRLMTLDPSAKIATFQEIRTFKDTAYHIREDAKEERKKVEREFFESSFDMNTIEGINQSWIESKLYQVAMGEGTGNMTNEQIKKVAKYQKDHPERMAEIQKLVERQKEIKRAANEKASKYDKFAHMDAGVVAAMLGYDAINAEGHGQSGSYTVVLNRTKVILSEDAVDVA